MGAIVSPNVLCSGVELPVDTHNAAIDATPKKEKATEEPSVHKSLSTQNYQCSSGLLFSLVDFCISWVQVRHVIAWFNEIFTSVEVAPHHYPVFEESEGKAEDHEKEEAAADSDFLWHAKHQKEWDTHDSVVEHRPVSPE